MPPALACAFEQEVRGVQAPFPGEGYPVRVNQEGVSPEAGLKRVELGRFVGAQAGKHERGAVDERHCAATSKTLEPACHFIGSSEELVRGEE
jgi:hypothetical protein